MDKARLRWSGVVVRTGAVVVAVVGTSITLVLLRSYRVTVTALFATSRLNHEVSYQLIGLGIAALFVLLAWLLGGAGVLQFLRPWRFNGEVTPVPWLGLRPKEGEGWLQVGTSFLVIITIVTAVAVYLPVIRSGEPGFSIGGVLLPALVFAVANSFTEEVIYRFAVTGVFLENGLSAGSAAITSGVLFGGVHYFGTPGGVPGVLLAGFLGWLLSKSIAETRGFGWAWLIHFVQDIVIFIAILGSTAGQA